MCVGVFCDEGLYVVLDVVELWFVVVLVFGDDVGGCVDYEYDVCIGGECLGGIVGDVGM